MLFDGGMPWPLWEAYMRNYWADANTETGETAVGGDGARPGPLGGFSGRPPDLRLVEQIPEART